MIPKSFRHQNKIRIIRGGDLNDFKLLIFYLFNLVAKWSYLSSWSYYLQSWMFEILMYISNHTAFFRLTKPAVFRGCEIHFLQKISVHRRNFLTPTTQEFTNEFFKQPHSVFPSFAPCFSQFLVGKSRPADIDPWAGQHRPPFHGFDFGKK